MEIDYSHMGSGKTTRILEWLKENQANLLIVNSIHSANLISNYSSNLGGRVITYNEFKNSPEKYSDCNIGIDQVDYIIDDIFNGKVKKITLTKEK